MIQRLSRKKFQIKAMDIESHNDYESMQKMETSCWLGCYLDEDSKIDDERSYFYSISEFLDRLEEDTRPKRNASKTRICNNIAIYIYNLSFEWSFILPVLLERGFKYKEVIEKEDEFCYNTVSTKSVSSVWLINLKFQKNHGSIIFRDLAKLFGGGLGEVAKSFGLDTQKGSIDYRLNRLHGHIVTQEEKDYCFKDTRIIIEILLKLQNDREFWNCSSMASYSMKKLLKRGWPRKMRPYKEYRTFYPELDKEESDFIRETVEGGLCYPVPKFQFKEINEQIAHIDKHQMHPSSAFFNLFPYGFGQYFIGKPPLGKICACRIKITYDYAILHSIIKLIGIPFITDKEITVWDFEIPTMYKCYMNLKITYLDGYAYKMKPLPWRRYYSDNYYKRLEAKKNKDEFNILYYKLLNNSSYGKHLEKAHNQRFINTVNEFGFIDSIIEQKEEIKVNAKYTYLGVGSCIPAYSRVDLIETGLKFEKPEDIKRGIVKNLLYFDTDSIFFKWNDFTKGVWETLDQTDFLGGWGWEEMISRAQFTAPKRYKLEVEGETTVKAGGINFDNWLEEHNYNSMNQVPFDEINIISDKFQVQRAFRVKGGTIIMLQEKEITIPEKYQTIYENNVDIK